MKHFFLAVFPWALVTKCCFIFSQTTAQAPIETGDFYQSDLIELIKLDPSFKLDIRYATPNNFVGKPVYNQARAFLQKPAAEALVKVQAALKPLGLGLLIFDGYRPWRITKLFWDITPDSLHHFVANPKSGSKHNRGCAIDLSLYNLKTGQEIEMTGAYDEMSQRSYPNYTGGTSEQRKYRDLLRKLMEEQGFHVYEYEWWHFDYKDWKKYRINDTPFENL
ncbi:MAG: M15 family metallopeptidase [Alphaproteobacteria bacterium]|nr:M15 family metallopeptidase [Alphaproteobacteria bacterium]